MKNKNIVAVVKKEIKLAEKRLSEVMTTEAKTDYQDAMLSIERAYADGYLEALWFVWDNISSTPSRTKKKPTKKKPTKKKPKKSKRR